MTRLAACILLLAWWSPAAATWFDVTPSLNVTRYEDVASTSDGQRIAAVGTDADSGFVWASADAGCTWAKTAAQPDAAHYNHVTLSADGLHIAVSQWVLGDSGTIWTSPDAGATWLQRDLTEVSQEGSQRGDMYWTALQYSDGGETLVGAGNADLYTSNDQGETWALWGQPYLVNPNNFMGISMSADGRVVAASANVGPVWVSNDSGATWAGSLVDGQERSLAGMAVSSDGQHMAVGDFTGTVWLSADAGGSWTAQSPFLGDSEMLYALWGSSDMQTVVVGTVGMAARPWISGDGGTTWEEATDAPPGSWAPIVVSGDGGRFLAVYSDPSQGGQGRPTLQTSKDPCDADEDGLPNQQEGYGVAQDTDGDGILDYMDADDDGDGIPTVTELALGDSDGDGTPDYLDTDDDNDTIPTALEIALGSGSALNDLDSDNIPDYLDTDDDGDGIETKDEIAGTCIGCQ